MTTKKTTKTKAAPKTAKKPKAAKAKKAEVPAPVEQTPRTSECPKGGDHEWTAEGDDRFCGKCKEPALTNGAKATKKKAKATKQPKEKKLSAIDAAAKLLSNAKEPMNTKELVDAMATKGLWTSPGGKTPHATLYSAILREIAAKGKDARFTKTERGKFASAAPK